MENLNKREGRKTAKEAEKELPKVTANLTVERIDDGYADCNVRLTVAEGQDKMESAEWRRFELMTENESERKRLEKTLWKSSLSRQELAIILFGLRVRPGFGKKDFGI